MNGFGTSPAGEEERRKDQARRFQEGGKKKVHKLTGIRGGIGVCTDKSSSEKKVDYIERGGGSSASDEIRVIANKKRK